MQTPPPSNPDPEEQPIPNNSVDMALHLTALRRLIVAWRERASVAAPEAASVYRRVEQDLSALITSEHPERRICWEAARDDLVLHIVRALRDGERVR